MAYESNTLHFSEEPELMNKAIPFGVEETRGVNAEGSAITLTQETWSAQQPTLESLPLNANSSTSTANPCLQIIVKYGNLEQQKVDVLAAPLLATNPDLGVLNITKDLKLIAGRKFCNLFHTVLNGRTTLKAGDCMSLPTAGGSYSLECKCVIFITCSMWSKANNSPEKDLRDGIRMFLNRCNSMEEVKSVALSAIGTGAVLNFPNVLAATIMGEEIKCFADRHPDTNIKEVQIVIKQLQNNESVYIAYREILLAMDLGPRIKLCNENGGCFNRIALGEHTQKKAGRITVSVVYGDIVDESTNAIINCTNYISWGAHSVAERIFTAAGADVIKSAREGSASGHRLVMTTAGPLSCDWILHCNCGGKLSNISDLVSEILHKCEDVGLQSVAIPAIGTGECKLRPDDVANHMMTGILHVTGKPNLNCLSCVRLITYSPYIYHTFCAALKNNFI